MLKNNLFSLVSLIFSCLVLFLIADVVSELLASLIVFLKKDFSHLVGIMSFRPSSPQDMLVE